MLHALETKIPPWPQPGAAKDRPLSEPHCQAGDIGHLWFLPNPWYLTTEHVSTVTWCFCSVLSSQTLFYHYKRMRFVLALQRHPRYRPASVFTVSKPCRKSWELLQLLQPCSSACSDVSTGGCATSNCWNLRWILIKLILLHKIIPQCFLNWSHCILWLSPNPCLKSISHPTLSLTSLPLSLCLCVCLCVHVWRRVYNNWFVWV